MAFKLLHKGISIALCGLAFLTTSKKEGRLEPLACEEMTHVFLGVGSEGATYFQELLASICLLAFTLES